MKKSLVLLSLALLGCGTDTASRVATSRAESVVERVLHAFPRARSPFALSAAVDERIHVARPEQPGVFVDLEPLGLSRAGLHRTDDAHVFLDALPSSDVVVLAEPGRVEELRLVRGPSPALSPRYRVHLGPELRELRAMGDVVLAVDAEGYTRLRTEPAFAIDSASERVALRPDVRRDGDAWLLSFHPSRALDRFPVVVDPAWVSGASMSTSRDQPAFAPFAGGTKLLCAGGRSGIGIVLPAEVFDAGKMSWKVVGATLQPRSGAKGVPLADGRVLVIGGSVVPGFSPGNTSEVFDPATEAFTQLATLPRNTAFDYPGAAPISDGALVVGLDGSANVPYTLRYATSGATWTTSTAPPANFGSEPGLLTLGSGKVLATGGDGTHTEAALFDPSTSTWSNPGPSLAAHGYGHRSVLLSSGKVLVVGRAGAELFDPAAPAGSRWTLLSSYAPPEDMGGMSALLLTDGRVLVAGGQAPTATHRETQIFDPATSAFRPAGLLATDRAWAAALALPSGRALIAGGFGSAGTLASTEIFTPLSLGGSCTQVGECTSGACVDGVCCSTSSCATGSTCAGSAAPGTCKLKNGQSCTSGASCGSGFCVDGMCCDVACTGACQACNLTGSTGTCSVRPSGTAPRVACGVGACAGSCGGSDPFQCTSFPSASVGCLDAACTTSGANAAASCDGRGYCSAPVITACGGFGCSVATDKKTSACKTSCADASDCAPGYTCAAGTCQKASDGSSCTKPDDCKSGNCVDGVCCGSASCTGGRRCDVAGKKGTCTLPTGAGCASATDCGSGFCVDGVCCASACEGTCEACDVTGSLGTCVAVVGRPHGARPACAGSGPCGGACDGTVRDACRFPGASTTCAPAGCDAGKESPASSCDGAGACVLATTHACEPYVCGADACRTSCRAAEDCAAGYSCDASGKCVLGSTCASPTVEKSPTGVEKDCSPFVCEGSGCKKSCSSTADCASGFTCNTETRVCITPAAEADSGGCSHGGRPGSGLVGWLLALALLVRQGRSRP